MSTGINVFYDVIIHFRQNLLENTTFYQSKSNETYLTTYSFPLAKVTLSWWFSIKTSRLSFYLVLQNLILGLSCSFIRQICQNANFHIQEKVKLYADVGNIISTAQKY